MWLKPFRIGYYGEMKERAVVGATSFYVAPKKTPISGGKAAAEYSILSIQTDVA
jgi:hypothetical protein